MKMNLALNTLHSNDVDFQDWILTWGCQAVLNQDDQFAHDHSIPMKRLDHCHLKLKRGWIRIQWR